MLFRLAEPPVYPCIPVRLPVCVVAFVWLGYNTRVCVPRQKERPSWRWMAGVAGSQGRMSASCLNDALIAVFLCSERPFRTTKDGGSFVRVQVWQKRSDWAIRFCLGFPAKWSGLHGSWAGSFVRLILSGLDCFSLVKRLIHFLDFSTVSSRYKLATIFIVSRDHFE